MTFIVSFSAVRMYLGHVPPQIMQPTEQLVAWFAMVHCITVTTKWMHLCVMLYQIRVVIKCHVARFAFSLPNMLFCYFVCEQPRTVLILIHTASVVHLQTMLVCYIFCTVTNINRSFKVFRIVALQDFSLKQIWIQNDFLYSLAESWKKCLKLQQLMYGILSLCAPTVRKSPYPSQRISHVNNNAECLQTFMMRTIPQGEDVIYLFHFLFFPCFFLFNESFCITLLNAMSLKQTHITWSNKIHNWRHKEWYKWNSSRRNLLQSTVMSLLMMGIHSEKHIIRKFYHCANIKECTHTNLDSVAYYTPSLYGIAHCS
jgi:hypothetical protein